MPRPIALNAKTGSEGKGLPPFPALADALGQGVFRLQKQLAPVYNKSHPVRRKTAVSVYLSPFIQETMHECKHRKLRFKCQSML